MAGSVRVEVVEGPMTGATFSFHEHDTFLFGRAPECHANLEDDSFISRYHFVLEINPPAVRLRDLGSLNGTVVNGEVALGRDGAQKKELDLRNGDRIQAGQTVFQVSMPQPKKTEPLPPRPAYEVSTVTGQDPNLLYPGYRTNELLGKGGMGEVLRAIRESDGQEVALKVLRPMGGAPKKASELFLREMEIIRQLDHPNIVRYLDSGRTGENVYVILEYCNRGSVADLMPRHGGRLPIDLGLAILDQVLRGLAHAHARNLVHRDIKPPNILLKGTRTDWRAKLADFGLAKCLDNVGLSGLTATGDYGGTVSFMPREQLTNYKRVRPASDVWSMAATFYAMVAGVPPRVVRPGQDPIDAVLQGRVTPIREHLPEMTPRLASVIDQALSPLPEARYANAAIFRTALNDVRFNGPANSGA